MRCPIKLGRGSSAGRRDLTQNTLSRRGSSCESQGFSSPVYKERSGRKLLRRFDIYGTPANKNDFVSIFRDAPCARFLRDLLEVCPDLKIEINGIGPIEFQAALQGMVDEGNYKGKPFGENYQTILTATKAEFVKEFEVSILRFSKVAEVSIPKVEWISEKTDKIY